MHSSSGLPTLLWYFQIISLLLYVPIKDRIRIGGRIITVLRQATDRGEDEVAEDLQGRQDYQESRPP